MSYVTLNEVDIQQIRLQRVRDLEVEKERLTLLLEEEPDDAATQQRMLAVTRYLALHIGKLSVSNTRPPGDAEELSGD